MKVVLVAVTALVAGYAVVAIWATVYVRRTEQAFRDYYDELGSRQ